MINGTTIWLLLIGYDDDDGGYGYGYENLKKNKII